MKPILFSIAWFLFVQTININGLNITYKLATAFVWFFALYGLLRDDKKTLPN